jgi:hypothetical protein
MTNAFRIPSNWALFLLLSPLDSAVTTAHVIGEQSTMFQQRPFGTANDSLLQGMQIDKKERALPHVTPREGQSPD